jgi:hypothetical protein
MFPSSSAASAASVSSPRLRDVLATLNVAGAAPLARRDGGVGNDVLERDTEEFGDTYSGTSLDSFVVSVPAQLSSQDYMVLEDKEYSSSSLIRNRSSVPREPRPYLTSLNAGPAKTFSLKLLPNEIGDLARICRTTIGKGGTFCTVVDCQVTHQGARVGFRPETLIVEKIPGKTAFLLPFADSAWLDPKLLEDWICTQKTLEAWTTCFDRVAKNFAVGTKVNAATLELASKEEKKALNFKTPRRPKKRSSSNLDTIERIGISPYARQLESGPEFFADLDSEATTEKLVEMVSALDEGVDQLGAFAVTLGQDLENSVNVQGLTNKMAEHNVNVIRRTLGSKPEHLKIDIESPTIWGAVALLLDKSENGPAFDTTKLVAAQDECNKRCSSLETDATISATSLAEALRAQGVRLDRLQDNSRRPSMGQIPSDLSSLRLAASECKSDVRDLRLEIKKLGRENAPQNVKFAGLNLDSFDQTKAWIAINASTSDLSFVVDPHTVFEHISSVISSCDFLSKYHQAHKLRIETLGQGCSMTSFEHPIPKIWTDKGTLVITDYSSYLSKIPTYEDWDLAGTGKRDSLIHDLEVFKISHQQAIDENLEVSSRVYAVARLSLVESVSIIEALIKFVDSFVKTLTNGKYSTKKAFHVTTRLIRRILMSMYEPRQGVLNSFKTSDLDKNGASIFWSTIRSLDIGLGLKRKGLENLPIVTSELVKFMLLNTGSETISALQAGNCLLKEQVTEAQRTAKAVDKANATLSNKHDELKKAHEALVKRLARLEGRPP